MLLTFLLPAILSAEACLEPLGEAVLACDFDVLRCYAKGWLQTGDPFLCEQCSSGFSCSQPACGLLVETYQKGSTGNFSGSLAYEL